MLKFIITVYLADGEVWETVRHTLEGMNNYCKGLFSDEDLGLDLHGGVVRYTVEEKIISRDIICIDGVATLASPSRRK